MTAASIITPPRVRPGDTIGIVTPAGPVRADRLANGLACLGDTFRLRIADSVTAPCWVNQRKMVEQP